MEHSDIDFKDPEFIFQNLSTLGIGDEQIAADEEIAGRADIIDAIAAQVCFYTLCTLRAYQGVIKAPRILIYGPGAVGTHIINSLIDYGCSSMLRIYVRNNLSLGKWRERGIKASDSVSKLLKAGTFEIVISTANSASFSQFTRDLFGKISPKTCVISAVFGLQRTRIYQLLKTPCVFRTFAERADVLKVKMDEVDRASPPHSPQRQEDIIGLQLNTLRRGAVLMATRVEDFKRQILMLENYYVMWGMTNEIAREQAINMTLGATNDALDLNSYPMSAMAVDAPESKDIHTETEEHPSVCETRSTTQAHDDESTMGGTQHDELPLTASKKKRNKVSALDQTVNKLSEHVGSIFQQEFSKIARIGDLLEFSEFRWDVFSNKATEPRMLGDKLAAQKSFENRNRGIVYVHTYLTDLEIKSLFRYDNEIPANYYYHSEVLDELDAAEALGLG